MRKRGMRTRINEMCRWCIHDRNSAGSWREQVYRCTAPECPLWDVRPIPAGRKPAKGEAA
jgi:hypothetical protein